MSVYADSIDDNDPQVLYSVGWELSTEDGSWTGTMHSTTTIGAWARVRFIGSRVAVVCTIPTGSGSLVMGSVSLDNGPAVNASYVTTPPVQWQTVLWDSGPLPFGSHFLVITNTGNQAYFGLDHIDYDPTSGNSPPSSSSKPLVSTAPIMIATTSTVMSVNASTNIRIDSSSFSSSIASTPSAAINVTSSTQLALGVPRSTGTTQSFQSSSTSPGGTGATGTDLDSGARSTSSMKSGTPVVIVTGILGSLLAILLICMLTLFLWRRRNRARYVDDSFSGRNGIPTPFNLSRTSREMSTSNLVAVRSGSFGNCTLRSATPAVTECHSSISGARSTSGLRQSMLVSSSTYASEEPPVRTSRPHQHQGNGGWTVGVATAKYAEAFRREEQLLGVSTSPPPAYPGSYVGPCLG